VSKSVANDFLNSDLAKIGSLELPEGFTARFDVMERLASNTFGETFLLSEKDGGKLFILKCYPKSIIDIEHSEAKHLSGLSHKGLPRIEAESENDEVVFNLREFAEGIPLDEFMEERGLLDKAQAIHIITKLCDVLNYLHCQSPPIIHRDIKPSNIIYDSNSGNVTLIDFGISRRYAETADTDTTNLGTKKFAPPEQYGFAQTDQRADIYALGVLLRFMVTGSIDKTAQDKKLERIISKCAAFSPKDRCQSAGAITKALRKYSMGAVERGLRIAASALALCLLLAAGIAVVRYTGLLNLQDPEAVDAAEAWGNGLLSFTGAEVGDEVYTFTEPLIERAARIALGYNAGTPVTQRDLTKIHELYIIGGDVFGSWNEYMDRTGWDGHICFVHYNTNGAALYNGVRSLTDLAGMTNLTKLAVIAESVTDISPLKGLPLEYLALCGNPVTDKDIAPLKECPYLTSLYIDGTDLTDLSVIRDLSALRALGVRDTNVTSLEPLTGLKIQNLIIPSGIEDLTPLAGLPLTELSLLRYPDDVDFICSLSTLEVIHYHESGIASLEPFERLTGLKTLFIGNNSLTSLEGVQRLAELRKITAGNNPITDISAVGNHPALEDIEINNCPVEDFSPLFDVANLQRANIDARQEKAIRAINPNPRFRMDVTGSGPDTSGNEVYTFTEPLIERAARLALGFDSNTPVTLRDLKEIHELYIIGGDVFGSWEGYMHRTGGGGHVCNNFYGRGSAALYNGVRSLTDLAGMASLTRLAVIVENVTDLSPLAGLPLEYLALCGNPVTNADVGPLKECPFLTSLYLCGTNITDLSFLRDLPALSAVGVQYTNVTSLEPLTGMNIKNIFLPSDIEDLTPLAKLPLTELHLTHYPDDIDFFCSLSDLEVVFVWESGITSLKPFERLLNLKILAINDANLTDLEGVQRLPQLWQITVSHNPITDISALRDHPAMEIVEINGCPVEDVSPLFDIANLRKVVIDSRQEQAIRAINPNPGFNMEVRD